MRVASDFYPCVERASFLVSNLRTRLVESITYLLDIASTDYGLDTQYSKKQLQKILHSSHISGYIFTVNQKLLQSLQKGSKEGLRAAVQEIDCGEYILPHFSVQPFASSPQKEQWMGEFICIDEMCYPAPTNCTPEQFIRTKAELKKVLQIIEEVDTVLYQELKTLVSEFLVFDSHALRSGTSFNLFGSIYINYVDDRRDWLGILEDIIHETAHMYLFSLAHNDPLVLNKMENMYAAPFRADKRPLIGIYHATFVLGKLLYFFHKFVKSQHILAISHKERIDKLIKMFHKKFAGGIEVIEKDGILTPLAKDLLQDTKERINLLKN